jgi:hypothetical protein
MHYTVKRGDTLWGIASMYLKDPWLWPEVWIINPQVPNPHLIYPGDKLALAYGAGGRLEVRLEQAGVSRLDPRLRSDPLANAIPTIPYSAIAAFLSRPTIMTSDEIRRAPYVLAFRDMHQVAGNEIEVYVRNLQAAENSRYAVMHVATPLVDPDDGKVVGYEGIYTATALVKRSGDPAKAVLIDLARETLAGDRLMSSDNEVPLNFSPAAPASDVHGRIIDVVGGTDRHRSGGRGGARSVRQWPFHRQQPERLQHPIRAACEAAERAGGHAAGVQNLRSHQLWADRGRFQHHPHRRPGP